MTTQHTSPLPPHVPAELAEITPIIMGQYTDENPFARIIPNACEGPDIAYATNMYLDGSPAWLLRRHEDLKQVFSDTEHFTSRGWSAFAAIVGENWHQVPVEVDPPQHGFFRAALNPLFTPSAVAKMDADIRHRARALIDRFKNKGECEFMTDFAFPFPVAIVLDLMQLPQSRLNEFRDWEQMLLHSGDLAVMAEGVRNVTGLLRQVIAERKQSPGEDFISFATQVSVNGRPMTDDELLGFAFNLYIGGLDTVSANLGNHFRYLAENPQQQELLRQQPEKISGAIEEMMRAFAAVTTFRICTRQTTINGVTMMPGDKVAMCTTLAGRDRETYDNPHQVIFDRTAKHVSFAYGPHFCIGAHLARRELRIAYEELLASLPPFRIKPGARIQSQQGGVIQPKTLPLVW